MIGILHNDIICSLWTPNKVKAWCQVFAKHFLICSSEQTQVLLLLLFYTWENWGSERILSLPKAKQLVGSKAGIQTDTRLTPKFSSTIFDTCRPFDILSSQASICMGPSCTGVDYEVLRGSCPEPQETEGSTWLMGKSLTGNNLLPCGLTSISALSLPTK